MVSVDVPRLERWARGTDVEIAGHLAELADGAADAVPAGRVDVLALVDGEVRTFSVSVRVDVWPRKRALQVAMDDQPILTRQAERAVDPAVGTGPWRGSCDVATSAGVLEAVRCVLGCLALVAKKAVALHKVTDAVADGRSWSLFPRIGKKQRVLKPHYRRAHWRRLKDRWVFVRATIVHADRLDVKVAADVAAMGVIYVPMREAKRRVLIEGRMMPHRIFGMVGSDVAQLAEELGLAYDRSIFSYMRAIALVLNELAYRESSWPPRGNLIPLWRARRALSHRLAPVVPV
jgi:hypothetical protein